MNPTPTRSGRPSGARPLDRRPRRSAPVAPDLWLLAVSLAAGVGAARLTRAPGAAHVVGPIVATVVVGHVATAAARRLRTAVPTAVVAGVVAVGLATVWGQFLSATRGGIPTVSTFHALVSRFAQAGVTIRSNPTPVPATPGVVLCVAVGAGLVAVIGRAIWAGLETRSTRPLSALVTLIPSFGIFCYTALLSSQVDRLAGAVAYLACALVFVLAADRPHPAGVSPSGMHRAGRPRRDGNRVQAPPGARSGLATLRSAVAGALPAVVAASAAVAVPLAVSPSFSALRVSALPFPHPGAGGDGVGVAGGGDSGAGAGLGLAGGGPADGFGSVSPGGGVYLGPAQSGVRSIDLVDDLQSVLTDRTTETMFTATSPVPTYWQIAVLTQFDGSSWLPDPTTEAAVEAYAQPMGDHAVTGLPDLPEPAATSTFKAAVTIDNLESTLLPLPPTAISVGAGADFIPSFGAVQGIESPAGESYGAVARVPASPNASSRTGPRRTTRPATAAGGPTGSGAPAAAGVSSAEVAPYLQLPTVDPAVVTLAHQIVAGASSPTVKASDLARWFNSGRYRYTLTPPPAPATDPLSWFLFTSKEGFCQQFAAAYAVLARVDGLPTRVAVGFTTGSSAGQDRYRITGADAHVWPEVYLGPSVGWTSYEPTPATAGEPTGIGVNSGARSAARSSSHGSGAQSTSTTASTIIPSHHFSFPRVPPPSTLPLVRRGAVRARTGRSGTFPVAAVAVPAVVVVLGAALLLLRRRRGGRGPFARGRRRRRRRHPPGADPDAEVLTEWREAAGELDRVRLGRKPAETLHEHAERLQALARTHWLAGSAGPPAGAPPAGAGATGTAPGVEGAVDAYRTLAALAARALYASGTCTREDAMEAEALADAVRSGLTTERDRRRSPLPV